MITPAPFSTNEDHFTGPLPSPPVSGEAGGSDDRETEVKVPSLPKGFGSISQPKKMRSFSTDEQKNLISTTSDILRGASPKISKSTLTRYPWATFPEKVKLESITPLQVWIKVDKPLSPVGVSPMKISTAGKTDKVPIMVTINSNAFEVIDGNMYKVVEVPVENKDIGPFLFLVRFNQEGLQSITLNFFQEGDCIGSIEVNTFVEPGNIKFDPEQSTKINSFKGTLLPNKLFGSDVTIIIQEVKTNPNFEYNILFYSKDTPYANMGPLIFPFNPESKFREIFKDIENSNLPANIVDDKIKSKGLLLYDELISRRSKGFILENQRFN